MIEDYAIIGNLRTAALVHRNGSIDWLPIPQFDSPACFAALLGSERNGRWQICPESHPEQIQRRYRERTVILETTYTTEQGRVVLTDAMSHRSDCEHVLRCVRGVEGCVPMRMALLLTSDYGLILPRIEKVTDEIYRAVGGPNQYVIKADTAMRVSDQDEICAEFTVNAGDELCFSVTWSPSHADSPSAPDVTDELSRLTQAWVDWSQSYEPPALWSDAVLRSLLTIHALTHDATGAFVAAPTTSLPETFRGDKNWDYRACWLRDGAFSVRPLVQVGFRRQVEFWCNWLLRAVAGSPDKLQIMYGIHSERNLDERKLPWLAGYEGSRPVQAGNEASEQFQLDVYGQVMETLFQAREAGIDLPASSWPMERALVNQVVSDWRNPGAGIWEARTEHQQYTESKILAWVALDRGVRTAARLHLEGELDLWREVRGEIYEEVMRAGFNPKVNSFVQYYGADILDGSLLLAPIVGFIDANDPRMVGTVSAIEKHLLRNGLVIRYHTYGSAAESKAHEGAFLPCSFWLVDNYVLQGRVDEGRELFERLLALRNDVGLLSEEYDTNARRMAGNYPQALSHAALISSALNLSAAIEKRKS